jgi:hypothetical protein
MSPNSDANNLNYPLLFTGIMFTATPTRDLLTARRAVDCTSYTSNRFNAVAPNANVFFAHSASLTEAQRLTFDFVT